MVRDYVNLYETRVDSKVIEKNIEKYQDVAVETVEYQDNY